ncbi:MAG: YVTN family beta-propeller domain-containing protein [Terriglobia bacterium]|nr:MAG: YVTN family beta-propeller domain-containing protein [Terriglobia bacterium]
MKSLKVRLWTVAVCTAGISAYLIGAPAVGGYHLIKKIPLGAAEGGGEYFDYITVDSAARRVYLSHGTEVKVLDADSFATLGTITGTKRNHGVALVGDLGKGFLTDGDAGQVVIFDLKTFKTTGQVKADKDADSILYDAASKHIFAFNGEPKTATVIDPASGSVVTTIQLGGQPEQAVSDGKGTIFDNLEDTNEVIAIDTRTNQVKSRWKVAPSGQPVAIAMDRQHRRLFISGRNPKLLVVMDADNGKIVGQSFPIGDRVDSNIFEPESALLFASTREGTIHIFHADSPDKLSPVETVKTEFGAKTMGLDAKTHNLFVDTSDFDPPAPPTQKQPNPQPRAKPGTFRLLVYGR